MLDSDDNNHNSTTATATTSNGGAPKRRFKLTRLPPLSDISTSGDVTFRLLCHVKKSGAVIGKYGSVVKLLEQETGAKIRIEDHIPYCHERVITIISPESPKTKITLKKQENSENADDEEEEVSAAQHGLIRVLERVLEAEEEIEEVFPTPGLRSGSVTCRLLADSSQIGYLMGKGGKRIKQIATDSGAKIRVSAERCPACASPTDELIQMSGDGLAVKKAVLAVSQCLQDSAPLDNTQMVGSKPYMAASNVNFSAPYTEFLPHQTSFLPPRVSSSVDYASRSYSMPAEEEVVFRLICSDDRIGGVIGKAGTIIKALQAETRASIRVGAPLDESDDRVIHVSAMENVESGVSPAQNAVVRVFTRSIEVGNEKKLESGANKDSKVEARLLVPSDHIGCVMGKGGTIMSEMRKVTRTSIWVLFRDQLPPCATENDVVIKIDGLLHNVQHALYIVTGRLRDNFFPNKMINAAGRIRAPTSSGSYPSMNLSHKLSQEASLTQSMHRLGISHPLDHSLTPKLRKSGMISGENTRGGMDTGRGEAVLRGGLENGSGSTCGVVKNTTLEILVPEHVLGSVYGEKESNLSRIRQISGAKVTVHESSPGTSEATVIISGTPDQTQAAQSVLNAFILSSGGS